MTPVLRGATRRIAYGLFVLLDHLCWLVIQVLPGPRLMALIRHRPWRSLQCPLRPIQQRLWSSRIRWLLRTRCLRASWGSSCLSRSISGRLLLDLIGVANELHLGMSKFDDGRKVPHAWLRDPSSGLLYTPGLNPGAGVDLTHL